MVMTGGWLNRRAGAALVVGYGAWVTAVLVH